MRKFSILFIVCIFSVQLASAQWQLTGNTGTNQNLNFVGTTDGQQLVFKTNNTIRMRLGTNSAITNFGAVSIGGLDPDNSLYGGTLLIKDLNTGTAISLVRGQNTASWDNQIRFFNHSNMRHVIADDYSTGKLVIQTNVDPLSNSVNLLDIRGRVQIGGGLIATPAGYNLYVEQGILTERVKVSLKTTADWADHVFHKKYKLMPLNKLEAYVLKNKHLPGIPTAQQMVKDGNDLAATDAKLLEKIEELTLYIIEINKENDLLKRKLENLSSLSVASNEYALQIAELSKKMELLKQKVESLSNVQR